MPPMSGFDENGCWKNFAGIAAPDVDADPALDAFISAEFPAIAGMARGPKRRQMLQIMAASFALGGLAGCKPSKKIQNTQNKLIPWVNQPPRILPGAALSYASSTLLDGVANGVLVTTRDGRPIKIEGNSAHPWSRGGTDIFSQASILGLYDPDRSRNVQHLGRASTWNAFASAWAGRPKSEFRLLTGPLSSPSMLAQIAAMQSAGMRWHVHTPLQNAGATQTRWRFDKADVVISLDGDFLDPGPGQTGLAREWSEARAKMAAGGQLLSLFSAAPTPGLTTSKADYPIAIRPEEIAMLAELLLQDIGKPPAPGEKYAAWRINAAAALNKSRGRGVVLTNAKQPEQVQVAVARLNAALGNNGRTVFQTSSCTAPASPLAELVADMQAGKVGALVMLGTNPAYTASGFGFAEALQRVPLKIHAGEYIDQTAIRSDWHVPLANKLESWGDARAYDGTISLLQPMVEPFYQGRSAPEILASLVGPKPQDGFALLQAYWNGKTNLNQSLEAGFIANSAFPLANPAPPPEASPVVASADGLNLVIRHDPTIYDGQFANIAWLQELPKPLTKTVWENIIAVSESLSKQHKLANGDVVEINAGNTKLRGPAWIVSGQQDQTLTAYLGYGQKQPGAIGDGLGYDAYPLSGQSGFVANVILTKTGERRDVPATQELYSMEGHGFARAQPPNAAPIAQPEQPTLYPPAKGDGIAWGMVIDLDACIGCNACVVACQAENNTPVIGPAEMLRGRDMHWLRIDRYDAPSAPATRFMPVPCMHCEDAPCEVACPVNAAVHNEEGLNLMVYNRCVGTRACEAYCPYKVRHFNFADYTANVPASIQAQFNPEVTVRGRGVMEKCTYCVQRIEAAHIAADEVNAPIADGAVKTACQAACPAQAISFGNIADPASIVAEQRKSGRHYTLLEELNTRPRTTYLAAFSPETKA